MNNEKPNSIGENIRIWRKALGLTQEQLGIKSNLAQCTITQVESDKRGFTHDSLKRITDALSMPIDAVFEENLSVKVVRSYDKKAIQKCSVTKYVITKSEFDKKEFKKKNNNKKELLEVLKELPLNILEHYACLMKLEARNFKKKR